MTTMCAGTGPWSGLGAAAAVAAGAVASTTSPATSARTEAPLPAPFRPDDGKLRQPEVARRRPAGGFDVGELPPEDVRVEVLPALGSGLLCHRLDPVRVGVAV